MALQLSLMVYSKFYVYCLGKTSVVTSVYAPKSCSTAFQEFTDLANITVKITYLDDKDSTFIYFLLSRHSINGYGVRYSEIVGKRDQTIFVPSNYNLGLCPSYL